MLEVVLVMQLELFKFAFVVFVHPVVAFHLPEPSRELKVFILNCFYKQFGPPRK